MIQQIRKNRTDTNVVNLLEHIEHYKTEIKKKPRYKKILEGEIINTLEKLCTYDNQNYLKHNLELLKYNDKNPMYMNNIAYSYLTDFNDYVKGEEYYLKAIELDPTLNIAYHGAIQIYKQTKNADKEIEMINRGIKNCPKDGEFYNFKGVHFFELNKIRDSFYWFKHGLRSDKKTLTRIQMNIGHVHSSLGNVDLAMKYFVESIDTDENHETAYENILLNIHYYKEVPTLIKNRFRADTISDLHKIFSNKLYGNPPKLRFDLEKKRIGFVTGDLVNHAVSMFTNVIFENKHKSIDIYLYSSKYVPDISVYNYNVNYRHIQNNTMDGIIDLISKDKINTLIDLSGFTSDNKLPLFGRLQNSNIRIMTFLGYPNSLGIRNSTRISDFFTEKFNNEPVLKMPRVFLCYRPSGVNINIVKKKLNNYEDRIVFGSFAKLQKINEEVIDTWIKILEMVENSILIIKNKYFSDPDTLKEWKEKFRQNNKVILLDSVTFYEDHLDMFNYLDVQLDTWPYSGTTITCESLFMNVPVVTYCPDNTQHVSRVSGSIINAMSMEDPVFGSLITYTLDDYIKTAINWVGKNKEVHRNFMKVMEPERYMREFTECILRV